MTLILLQPGIQPLGQFDIRDEDIDLVVGGKVAIFADRSTGDLASSDSFNPGPELFMALGTVGLFSKISPIYYRAYGLVDDGSSSGLNGKGYGTLFGQVIGATVGQGTGIGDLSNIGVVTVGPSTVRGSGKVTVWDKPGLYGVTKDAFIPATPPGFSFTPIPDGAEEARTINKILYGTPGFLQSGVASGDAEFFNENRGKLSSVSYLADYVLTTQIGYSLGTVSDSSFVSTPNYYAGNMAKDEYWALYNVGAK